MSTDHFLPVGITPFLYPHCMESLLFRHPGMKEFGFFFFYICFTFWPLNKTDSYCSYPSQILLRAESDGVVLNFCMHRELSYEEDLIKLLV